MNEPLGLAAEVPASEVLEGSGLREISSGENDRLSAWSPDGTRIAFVRGHQLFTMASDGSDMQRVEGVSPEGAIAWNPLG